MGGRSNGNLYLQGRFFKGRFGGIVISQPPPALVGITAGFGGVTISGGGATTATFTVQKSDDLLLTPVTVGWAIAGTGAHPLTGANFSGGVLPSGTISLPAGTLTATTTVTFAAGSTPASALTGHLALSAPTGGATIDPNAAGFDLQINSGALTGTVSITGSFSTVTVNQASQTTATFTVSKTSNIQGSSVTVPWAVTGTGGSPAKGSDFAGGTLPTGNLVIGVGVLAAAVTLTFAAEAPPAAAETGLVTLGTPSVGPATLGTPSSFGFTIASQVIQPPGTHVGVAASFSSVTVDPLNQVVASVSVGKTGVTNVACTVDYAVTGDPSAAHQITAADFGGVLPSGTLSIGAALASKQISLTFAAENPPANDRGGLFTLSNPQPAASVDLDQANTGFPFIINKAVVLSANRSGLAWKSGVTVPDNTMPGIKAQVEAFETYRGRLVDVVGVKVIAPNANVTWSQYGTQAGAKAAIFTWLNAAKDALGNPKPIQAALSVALICKTNGGITMDVAGGAEGADVTTFINAHKAAAKAIAAMNPALPVIVRIGREYTATPGDFSCLDQDSDQVDFSHFKLAHQRAADAWHTSLPGCIIDGCSLYGNKGFAFNKYYPGDAYWDVIGADMYDNQGTGVTDKASWLAYRDASNGGPTYWLNFAKAHNKKLSIAELALSRGDHEAWIYGFWHEFLTTNAAHISHEVYFDIQDGTVVHQLNDGALNPRATLEYKTFMSNGGSNYFPSGW